MDFSHYCTCNSYSSEPNHRKKNGAKILSLWVLSLIMNKGLKISLIVIGIAISITVGYLIWRRYRYPEESNSGIASMDVSDGFIASVENSSQIQFPASQKKKIVIRKNQLKLT